MELLNYGTISVKVRMFWGWRVGDSHRIVYMCVNYLWDCSVDNDYDGKCLLGVLALSLSQRRAGVILAEVLPFTQKGFMVRV